MQEPLHGQNVLPRATPSSSVVGLEFLLKLETEMRHAAEKAGCRYPTFRVSVVDSVGTETFDSVSDDAVPLRLAQFHSVHLVLQSEEDGFSVSLDLESFGGEAQLKVQMTDAHAREEALQRGKRRDAWMGTLLPQDPREPNEGWTGP